MKYEEFSCLLPTSQVAVPEEEIATLVGKEISVALLEWTMVESASLYRFSGE